MRSSPAHPAAPAKTIYTEYGYVIYIYIYIDTSYAYYTYARVRFFNLYISTRGIIRGFAKIGCKTLIILYRYIRPIGTLCIYVHAIAYVSIYPYISTRYQQSIHRTGGPKNVRWLDNIKRENIARTSFANCRSPIIIYLYIYIIFRDELDSNEERRAPDIRRTV